MKLVTHNGHFHYDEVLATAVLLEIYPDAELTRTRDASVIEAGDIVFDVGAEFDPAKNRFDHHQKSFDHTFSANYDIKLSSAGLIFKFFHERLFEKYGVFKTSPIFNDVKTKIYEEMFLPADAIDNGVDIAGKINPRTIADVVSSFNSYSEDESSISEDSRFKDALSFVQTDLRNYLNHVKHGFVANYEALYNILKDFDGEIFVAEKKVPMDLIFDVSKKLNKDIKYVIFKGDQQFRIYTIPVEKGSFKMKWPLHENWRGLRNEELVKASGISGCTFVHASGFTGGNETFDGAIKMCIESIKKLNEDSKN